MELSMSSCLKGLLIFLCYGCLSGVLVARGDDKSAVAGSKETLVATLSKDQIQEFSVFVRNRNLRREELVVTTRIWVEKQRELKAFMDEMSKEFGMSPEHSYSYEIESKSLYQLATNKTDTVGKPDRKLVRTIKSDSESKYISRLMVARKLTEQQLQVLMQLRAEKQQEATLMDGKLRQTFKLDPEAGYRLDEKTGQVFRQPASEKPTEPVKESGQKPANSAKKSSQNK